MLKNNEGIPNVHYYYEGRNYNYMVIDLLGKSIEYYLNKYKNLSLKTTIMLGIQMVFKYDNNNNNININLFIY
jgi:hypothetical protein